MITAASAKQKSDAELTYARKDLNEVIAVQEATVREHGALACPKLGQYWDELSAVLGEVRRRQGVK